MTSLEISYKLLAFDELDARESELIKLCEESLKKAHAPYSKFTVGSAVRMADGQIYTGSNQENAAYPSGLCAERVALFKAKSETKGAVEAIAVLARNQHNKPADAFSCGGCRQVMMEYAGLQDTPVKIIMGNHEGRFIVLKDVRLLMPFGFEAKTLK